MKNLKTRIQNNLTTKSGSIKVAYQGTLFLIENPKETIRPVSWSNKGRSLRDSSGDLEKGLMLIGVDFETGNDALRGGKSGYFVRLTSKGKRQVAKYASEKRKEEQIKMESIKKVKKLAEKAKEKRLEELRLISDSIENKEDLLKEFFSNEIHPAPQNITAIVASSGSSWRALRRLHA